MKCRKCPITGQSLQKYGCFDGFYIVQIFLGPCIIKLGQNGAMKESQFYWIINSGFCLVTINRYFKNRSLLIHFLNIESNLTEVSQISHYVEVLYLVSVTTCHCICCTCRYRCFIFEVQWFVGDVYSIHVVFMCIDSLVYEKKQM